jgi:hypothetical protein
LLEARVLAAKVVDRRLQRGGRLARGDLGLVSGGSGKAIGELAQFL